MVCASPLAFADFSGKVIGITDGDTITVLREKTPVKIRLADIDAPESAQPFGNRAKQTLSDLAFGKVVRVDARGKDKYRRTLATIYIDDKNVNAEMVRLGMAWVYRKHAPKKPGLYRIESEAKLARRGLWADSKPVPP
ncbi:MAG: thermonuclease family protein [Aeromicrobium sp.]|nr:thermonuclease family protein [Burkholderiales bacterium]